MTTTNEKLWCIHIPGPDDLYSAPSHEMAEHMAACHNAAMKEFFDRNPEKLTQWGVTFDEIKARVIEWTHGADEHADDLAEFDPEEWALDEPAATGNEEGSNKMNTTQQAALLNEAAKLADELDHEASKRACNVAMMPASLPVDAAKELRRLDARVAELETCREALINATTAKGQHLTMLEGQRDQLLAQVGQMQAILAKLQATQEPVHAGELPAFEQWWRQRQLLTFPKGYDQSRLADWGAAYKPAAKDAWQARAALSARKPLTDETFVAACNGCPTPGKCKDTSGCASAGMNVPTYYVRHPDDTYTAADPQPRFNGIGLEVKP